jgi:hypothetical protein
MIPPAATQAPAPVPEDQWLPMSRRIIKEKRRAYNVKYWKEVENHDSVRRERKKRIRKAECSKTATDTDMEMPDMEMPDMAMPGWDAEDWDVTADAEVELPTINQNGNIPNLSARKMKELNELREAGNRIAANPKWLGLSDDLDPAFGPAAANHGETRQTFQQVFMDGDYGLQKGERKGKRVEKVARYRPESFLPRVEKYVHEKCGNETEFESCDKCNWFCPRPFCGMANPNEMVCCLACSINPVRQVRKKRRINLGQSMGEQSDLDEESELDDGAYDGVDEAKVKKMMVLTEFGRLETKYQATAELNNRLLVKWTSKKGEIHQQAKEQPALLCFIPRAEHRTSGMRLRSQLDIGDPRVVRKLVQEVVVIEKGLRQITFQLRMDLKLHLGTSTRMAGFIEKELNLGKRFRRYASTMDHPYDNQQPMRPCVLNTTDEKGLDGKTPLLDTMERLVSEVVVGHLGDFLTTSNKMGGEADKRVKHYTTVGFTDVQAACWERNSEFDHALMGLIRDPLSAKCLTKVGALVNFLSHEVVKTALVGTNCQHFFSLDPESTIYLKYLKRIQKKLNLPEAKWGDNLAENVQFNFGRPENLCGHYDSKDDTRENRNGHVTACAALPIQRFKAADRDLLAKLQLVNDGLVWVTVIVFTRKAVGDQAAILDGKAELKTEVERLMHGVLTSDASDLKDVELLDGKHMDELEILHKKAKGLEFSGHYATRPEGRRKELFYASSLHAALKLLARFHTILPNTYNTLVDLLLVIGHQNGQHLQYTILSKWSSEGTFQATTFADGWKAHQDLYIMFCKEVIWSAGRKGRKKTKWLGGSEINRFVLQQDLLYRPDKGDSLARYRTRRTAICRAINRSNALLHKHPWRYERKLAAAVLSEFKCVDGIGHLFGQQFVQFGARLGLLPAFLCEFGMVNGDKKSTSGPSLFMRSNCDECSGSSSGCQCDEATVEAKFYQMVDTLRDDHRLNITDMIAENCSCLQSRMSRVDGDKRKKDLIFWDGDGPDSIQNFFVYNSKLAQSTGGKMILFYLGKKQALEDVFCVATKNMAAYIAEPRKSGCFEWRIPKWAPKTLPKNKKVWYPQSVFAK